jgi:eukaryotic-like serine/threonine-protein kinase
VPVVAKPTRRGAPASTPTPAATKTEPAAEPGFFSVNSDPYATIFVDGKRLGDTPLYREPIAAGPHRVRAVRADGRERTFAIKVPPGKELNSGKLVW